MPIQVANPANPTVKIYVIWDNPEAQITVSAFSDSQAQTALPITEEFHDSTAERAVARYDLTITNPDQLAYLALIDSFYFRPNETETTFSIFLVNAAIESLPLSGNSIPRPNDNFSTLTIGSKTIPGALLRSSQSAAAGKPELLTIGQSFVKDSEERGTGFSTLIVAGVAATYWSKDTTLSVSDIRSRLLADNLHQVLTISKLGEDDGLPWYLVAAAVVATVAIATAITTAILWRCDRQYAIQRLRETEFRAELSSDGHSLSIWFELPLRRNGYPYLRRFFKSLRIDLAFDPRLSQKPIFDSWLANINVHRAHNHITEMSRDGLRLRRQQGATTDDKLILCTHLSEREAMLAIDLCFQYHLQLPVELVFTNLEWYGSSLGPDRVQLPLKLSFNESILLSTVLIAERISGEIASLPAVSTVPEKELHSTPESTARRVFVSYSSKNRPFVQELLDQLRRISACEFWIDCEQIPDGVPFWDREIQRGLDSCDRMLLIMTPQAAQSDEVGREWNYFLLKEKRILVLVRDLNPSNIHYRLSPSQMIFYDKTKAADIVQRITVCLLCPE